MGVYQRTSQRVTSNFNFAFILFLAVNFCTLQIVFFKFEENTRAKYFKNYVLYNFNVITIIFNNNNNKTPR